MLSRPQDCTKDAFDLIVVGAGISGIMMALEAVRRGLRPLLLESGDFAAATSHNSLRIVHGGLRYLQKADIKRHLHSTRERRWFLRNFPDLVHPLPCLLPLYGKGLQRPAVLRMALAGNDLLSSRRNHGVSKGAHLAAGRLLSPDETRSVCSEIDPVGLQGAALWYDGFASNLPRLMIEALHWACAEGATVLNHTKALGLETAGGRITGIRALDQRAGVEASFRGSIVVSTTGPWADRFIENCGEDGERLFVPLLAWNLVFDRPQISDHAIAASDRENGGPAYFFVPWKGALAVGTGYAVWREGPENPQPSRDQLRDYLDAINRALPGLELSEGEIARVYSGLLPAKSTDPSALDDRPIIVDHSKAGGPWGLFTACEVKFTTARSLAEDLLRQVFPSHPPRSECNFVRPKRPLPPDYPFFETPRLEDDSWKAYLRSAIDREAAESLTDLLLRRSTLGDNPKRALALASEAARLFHWDEKRQTREINDLKKALDLQQSD